MIKSNRYQDQPWYIRVWRRRHYLLIPVRTITIYWNTRQEEEHRMSLNNCYSLAIGLAQVDMKWYYDWEEVKKRMSRNK